MRYIYFSLIILIVLSGCINENNTPNEDTPNANQTLNVGVMGAPPKENFESVNFHSVNVDILKEDNNNTDFDAYFITDGYFQELSKNEWAPILSKINTPVFFVNSNTHPLAFRVEDIHYNDSGYRATEHTNGFVSEPDEGHFKTWGYGNPSESTSVEDTPEWIFQAIFQDIIHYNED